MSEVVSRQTIDVDDHGQNEHNAMLSSKSLGLQRTPYRLRSPDNHSTEVYDDEILNDWRRVWN